MQAKDWNLPMVDVTGRKYEVTIQSVSLLNAVLSMHYRQPYADPVIDGMGFTDQERAVIDHSKYVKDMREESLNLALKTMNQAYWQRSQEKSRRLYLELQISQGRFQNTGTITIFDAEVVKLLYLQNRVIYGLSEVISVTIIALVTN